MKEIILSFVAFVSATFVIIGLGKFLERFSDKGWAPIIKLIAMTLLFIIFCIVMGKIQN
ncbi:MAG: hypothetical protein J6L91_00665 [Clostridia bacterium]|nr:hypothetical protein [Clostridia bacterium]